MKNLRYWVAAITALDLLSIILIAQNWVFVMLFFLFWIGNIFLCGVFASKLGRRPISWGIGALFLPIIIPLILIFQKAVVKPIQAQVLRVKANPSLTNPVVINKLSIDKAAVNTSFDVNRLVESLDNELVSEFTKKGYQVAESYDEYPTIDGSFIMVDEGSRLVRGISLWGGDAKVEIECTIKEKGKVVKAFHLDDKGYAGWGQSSGSESQTILINATKNLSKKILTEFTAKREIKDYEVAQPAESSQRRWEAFVEINSRKIPREELIRQMVAGGLSEPEAQEICVKEERKKLKTCLFMVFGGLVASIVGIILTVTSYSSAERATSTSGSATYYIFYGLIIFGVGTFFVGVYRLLSKKNR